MKIGDKVILKKHYQHESEITDWSVSANLPLNVPLIVEGFSSTGKWINFKGYRLNHPPEKFIPYTEPKTTNNMKAQYLTRDQLIIFLNEFECSTWKNEIKKLLTGHEFSTGNTKIDVTGSISKLISEGTPSQKSAVQNLGITLVEDKSVKIPRFNSIRDENDVELIARRHYEEFEGKAFYLGSEFNWELKKDSRDVLCLVPTKK